MVRIAAEKVGKLENLEWFWFSDRVRLSRN